MFPLTSPPSPQSSTSWTLHRMGTFDIVLLALLGVITSVGSIYLCCAFCCTSQGRARMGRNTTTTIPVRARDLESGSDDNLPPLYSPAPSYQASHNQHQQQQQQNKNNGVTTTTTALPDYYSAYNSAYHQQQGARVTTPAPAVTTDSGWTDPATQSRNAIEMRSLSGLTLEEEHGVATRPRDFV